MILQDIVTGREYSLPDLKREYIIFKSEDTYNHAETFKTELFEILMATINGRNDMDIIGMTPPEITRFILKLKKECIP